MKNTNCIDCIDVQNPVKISKAFVKHRQWAESDARFLRMISESSRDGAVGGGGPSADGYACRQRFLRSYKFSQKEETVAQRTKKWLRGAKQSTAAQSTLKEEGKNEFGQKEETVAQRTKKWLRGAKQSTAAQSTLKEEGKNENEDKGKNEKSDGDGSCSFLEAVFNFLFLCVAKVDVDDVVLRARPAKA